MSETTTAIQEITLKVGEAAGKDVGRGLARIDPADMRNSARRSATSWKWRGGRPPSASCCRPSRRAAAPGGSRSTASSARTPAWRIDETATVRRATAQPAVEVVLEPLGYTPSSRDLEYIGSLLDGLPVIAGDRVRATLFGNRHADFLVKSTDPKGPAAIASDTLLKIGSPRKGEAGHRCGCGGSGARHLLRRHRRPAAAA